MYTSNYWTHGSDPLAVSIAGKCPIWYSGGREYKKLAPKLWFFKEWKDNHDNDFYVKCYNREVLSVLNPEEVFKELGEDSILLCWEGPNSFCHRHLVAAWLERSLNIVVPEIGK